MRRIGLIIGHGRCPALICGLILDVADVCLEWRQPTHVDQAVVLAAINISSRVFTSAARDDLTDQLEILILHVASSLVEKLSIASVVTGPKAMASGATCKSRTVSGWLQGELQPPK
jgi:hypothetical protein